MTRSSLGVLWVLVAFAVLVACDVGQSTGAPTSVATTSRTAQLSSTSSSPSLQTTPTTPSTPLEGARGCEERISLVDIDEPPEYVERSIRVGPVLFGNAATLDQVAVELGPDAEERYPSIKIPLTVAAGMAATVEIGPSSQTWASLAYDTESFRSPARYYLGEGAQAVTFTACTEGDTFFNGGVIVAAPGCLELLVTTETGQRRAVVPIALTEC